MAMSTHTFDGIKTIIKGLADIKVKMLELEFQDDEDNIVFEVEVNAIDTIIGELIDKLRKY